MLYFYHSLPIWMGFSTKLRWSECHCHSGRLLKICDILQTSDSFCLIHWRSLLLWIQVTWESWFLFVIRIISTTRKIPSKKLIRLKMIRFYLVGYQSLNQAWCRNIQILWKWSILKYYFRNLESFVSSRKYRSLSSTYFCFLQKIR